MKLAVTFGLLLSLFFIFLQDWKYRKIHIALPLLVFSFSILGNQLTFRFEWKLVMQNIFFFCLVFVMMFIYMSAKNKKISNPFESYFGLGDFIFYVAVTPLFELKKYIIYFITSMLFAIVLQQVFVKKIPHHSIPLAGFSAILLSVIILFDVIKSLKITLL